jgi:hypothetical protein
MTEGGKGRWMNQGWEIADLRKRKMAEGGKGNRCKEGESEI